MEHGSIQLFQDNRAFKLAFKIEMPTYMYDQSPIQMNCLNIFRSRLGCEKRFQLKLPISYDLSSCLLFTQLFPGIIKHVKQQGINATFHHMPFVTDIEHQTLARKRLRDYNNVPTSGGDIKPPTEKFPFFIFNEHYKIAVIRLWSSIWWTSTLVLVLLIQDIYMI
ncbi:unnamed protein product [Owenia fusiformis]|uniref:Uncharacterized protein n=1 Tax=Owenia fusiformis TaxID=6347 RepID=A0A8S4MVM0_OWEFU|nr:unnamed protein product [Owenia fusiformis]